MAGLSKGIASLERILELAEYEIHNDPYRGLGMLARASGNRADPGVRGDEDDAMTVGNGGRDDGTDTLSDFDIGMPWQSCVWGSLRADTLTAAGERSSEKGIGPDQGSNPDSGLDVAGCHAVDVTNADLLVRGMLHCSCPSITKWTSEAISQREKEQARMKKRKGSSSRQTKITSMFPSSNGKNENHDSSSVPIPPPPVGTRSSVQMKNNAKPEEYRCCCDFNPLCLGSLGGVVDEILEHRAKEILRRKLTVDSSSENRQNSGLESRCNKDSLLGTDDASMVESDAEDRVEVVMTKSKDLISPDPFEFVGKSDEKDGDAVVDADNTEKKQPLATKNSPHVIELDDEDKKPAAIDRPDPPEVSGSISTRGSKRRTYSTAAMSSMNSVSGTDSANGSNTNGKKRTGCEFFYFPPLKELRADFEALEGPALSAYPDIFDQERGRDIDNGQCD